MNYVNFDRKLGVFNTGLNAVKRITAFPAHKMRILHLKKTVFAPLKAALTKHAFASSFGAIYRDRLNLKFVLFNVNNLWPTQQETALSCSYVYLAIKKTNVAQNSLTKEIFASCFSRRISRPINHLCFNINEQ